MTDARNRAGRGTAIGIATRPTSGASIALQRTQARAPSIFRLDDNYDQKNLARSLNLFVRDSVHTFEAISAAFAEMEGRIDSVRFEESAGTDLTDIERRLRIAEDDIDAVEGDIASLQAADIALDARLDTAEADITALEAVDVTLDGRLDAAEADITALEAADVSLDSRLDTAEAELADITSGTWTPVLTNGTNVAASTANPCQYTRVGNVVSFSGTAQVDPTTAGLLTTIGLSLPVASALAQAYQLAGTGWSSSIGLDPPLAVSGDAANDRMTISGVPVGAGNVTWYFTGSYLVV